MKAVVDKSRNRIVIKGMETGNFSVKITPFTENKDTFGRNEGESVATPVVKQ